MKKTTFTLLSIFIFTIVGFSQISKDSKGTDFWLMFNSNESSNTTPKLFISSDVNTSGVINIPGLAFTQSFSVLANTVTIVTLPSSVTTHANDVIDNKGIHVTSLQDITVAGLNYQQYTTDAYLGLPTDAIGKDYMVLSYKNSNVVNGSELGIVGTVDGTIVTITPRLTTLTHTAGTPFTITLNQGQTYELQDVNPTGDVTGTTINSTQPIGVMGASKCANIPSGSTYCDHICEMLPPISAWGKNFGGVPLANRVGGDTWRFLASEDGTLITINGVTEVAINKGQFVEKIITNSSLITSNKPILVAQYCNGQSYGPSTTGDPFMMLVAPLEQYLAGYTLSTVSGFTTNYVNIITPVTGIGSITLDGTTIASDSFNAIGATGFSAAQIAVTDGTHNLNGIIPFGVFQYGFTGYDSYGYSNGGLFSPISYITNIALNPTTGNGYINSENCINVTVTNQNGDTLSGVRVDFTSTGANPHTGFALSDNYGVASYCYTGHNVGSDSIVASVANLNASGTFNWLPLPTISCPANITVNNTFGQCGANVSFEATATGTPTPTITYSPESGSLFPVGITTVTATATNIGGTDSCTFTVTVNDTQAPNLIGPGNQTLNVIAGTCAANFTITDPISDNCSGATWGYTLSGATTATLSGIADGTSSGVLSFNKGVTTVTLNGTDGTNTAISTSFTVTVIDNEVPVINCPLNISVNNDVDKSGANVTFAATAIDCSEVTLSYIPDSGSFFPIGSTQVTVIATDIYNNTSNCTFTVTVIDARPVITCPGNITVNNTTGQCGANVTFAATATGLGLSSLVSQSSSRVIVPNTGISCNSGVNTYYRVFDLATLGYSNGLLLDTINFGVEVSGANTTATVNAYTLSGDFILANLTPIATQTVAVSTSANAFYSASMGGVMVPANSKLVIAYSVPYNYFYPGANPYGETGSSYISANGCSVSEPMTYASLGFGANHLVLDFNATLPPTIVTNYTSGSNFSVGTTQVTATATNSYGSSFCTFDITVNDTELPIISCQSNITDVVATSAAGAIVDYTTPVGTDNCLGAITTRIVGPASGDIFPIGTTTVTHQVTDASGLMAECSFDVTVVGVAPQIVCPGNIIVSNDKGQCGAAVTFTATEATGIPAPVITYSTASGSNFPVGTTTVTATATNALGNSSCTFDVTVNDTELPIITCLEDINITSNIGCAAIVNVGTATATDNCGVDHISGARNDGLALTDLYPIGVTVISWTATDYNGNDSIICEQTITVSGQQAFASPASQTICSGSSITDIVMSGSVAGTTYSWIRDNTSNVTGIAASGSGDISGILTNTTDEPIIVTFTISPTFNGCVGKSISAMVTVNPVSIAPSTITSSVQLPNPGSNFTLSVNGGSLGTGAVWKWYTGYCGGTYIGTGASISLSQMVNTTYFVRAEGICNSTDCASLTVNIKCGATAINSTAGETAICAGNLVTLTPVGALSTGAQWRWDDDCDAVPSPSDTSATYTTASIFNVTPTKTTTYFLQSVGGVCDVSTCVSVTVNVLAKPEMPGNINGLALVCPSTSGTYSITAVPNATSYTWTAPANATITSGQGTTSVTFAFASGFTSGYLSVTANNCSGASSAKKLSIIKTAAPSTPGTISGLITVCPNSSGNYSIATVVGATGYTWIAPANASITSGQGTTSVTVSYGNGFTTGTLSVKAIGCGGTSAAKTITITKTGVPSTPATISGLATVCPNTSCNYSIAAVVSATGYTWIAPANASITSGQGTTSVTVSYASGFTTGSLSVTAKSCGGTSAAKTLTITKASAPSTPGTISGLATVCPGTSATYSIASVVGATGYTWIAPANASIASGQGTTSVTVSYTSGFTMGTLSVAATGCSGTSAAKTMTISKIAVPATPGSISGASPVCTSSIQTYSIDAVTNATSYSWTLPTGMSYVANTNTTGTSIQVVLANNFSGGTLSVRSNNCSGSSATISRVLTASTVPTGPGAITGSTSVCPGTKNIVYSVAAATGCTFNWTVPSGCAITYGAGTNSIKVTWGTVAGTVSVTKVNSCGNSVASTLAVAVGVCKTTEPIVTKSFNVIAYPNPFANNFMIDVKSSSQSPVNLKVYDMIGRLIEQLDVNVSDLVTSTIGNRYPIGVYNVVVSQDDSLETVRVVKR